MIKTSLLNIIVNFYIYVMIRRYNDFLNESLIQDDLINKLLNIGGNNVILW